MTSTAFNDNYGYYDYILPSPAPVPRRCERTQSQLHSGISSGGGGGVVVSTSRSRSTRTNNSSGHGTNGNNSGFGASAAAAVTSTGDQKYRVEFVVGAFRPDDFQIKLKDRKLVVHAERTSARQVASLTESERFRRDIHLPEFVLLDTVACYLETYEDELNLLVIEAALVPITSNAPHQQHQQQPHRDEQIRPVHHHHHHHHRFQNQQQQQQTSIFDRQPQHQQHQQRKGAVPRSASLCFASKPRRDSRPKENGRDGVGCLKYKFDLSEFHSQNITISIRNNKTLDVCAFKEVSPGNCKQFRHEIDLPDNVQLYNIRNSFDEYDGILRIELPLDSASSSSASSATTVTRQQQQQQQLQRHPSTTTLTSDCIGNNGELNQCRVEQQQQQQPQASRSNDKYLELMFNLFEFKFDNLDVYTNERNENVLLVKAFKTTDVVAGSSGADVGASSSSSQPQQYVKSYVRKYILPEWVSTNNINVFQETNEINDTLRNTLVVQLPIVD